MTGAMIGRAFLFAGRNLLRQPGRATVGILGIAAVGALLFDMLLLSRGLVVSFRDLLDSIGFDVRVLASDGAPRGGPRLADAAAISRQLRTLPEIDEVVTIRMLDASIDEQNGHAALHFELTAVDPVKRRPWTIQAGRDLSGEQSGLPADILINPKLADVLRAKPGDTIPVRVSCVDGRAAMPPVNFRVSGIATFPFDDEQWMSGTALTDSVLAACGGNRSVPAEMILIGA